MVVITWLSRWWPAAGTRGSHSDVEEAKGCWCVCRHSGGAFLSSQAVRGESASEPEVLGHLRRLLTFRGPSDKNKISETLHFLISLNPKLILFKQSFFELHYINFPKSIK